MKSISIVYIILNTNMAITRKWPFSGLECELGDRLHDDSVRKWGECRLPMCFCWMQSCSWVHWRLHLSLNEEQGKQPSAEWGIVPQTYWWLDIKTWIKKFKQHYILLFKLESDTSLHFSVFWMAFTTVQFLL